ncbi:MAG: 50S ribosomal protein L24 [Candidatus Nanoarchaeia archaeon]|nr:50S ribosomal protein L24 [Candidatus Nanoarchaeia archaeon]
MKKFSRSWISSKNPNKQRKYVANAPLDVRKKLLKVHLSKPLKEKYGKRTVLIKKGDTVKVMVGSFKGIIGKVSKVSYKNLRIFVEGVKTRKADGKDVLVGINPSNVQIEELDLKDKIRQKSITKK